MKVIRRLSHSPDIGIYELMTMSDGRELYSAMTEEELSAAIMDERDPLMETTLRAMRRLCHRYPWTWIPATAADGRKN